MLGLPSPPKIFAKSDENYETFNLTINPPEIAKFCVSQYNINLTDNANNFYNGFIHVENPQESIVVVDIKTIIGNVALDICRLRYSFQVAANNGRTTPPTAPYVDFTSMLFVLYFYMYMPLRHYFIIIIHLIPENITSLLAECYRHRCSAANQRLSDGIYLIICAQSTMTIL